MLRAHVVGLASMSTWTMRWYAVAGDTAHYGTTPFVTPSRSRVLVGYKQEREAKRHTMEGRLGFVCPAVARRKSGSRARLQAPDAALIPL